MVSFLSHLNLAPSFPSYTGPHSVGSYSVEIPVTDLVSPSSSPTPDPRVSTIAFRIFYPCETPPNAKPVYWIPDPQKEYLRAYARFCGASARISGVIQHIPLFSLLSYVTIPSFRNARLSPAPTNQEWPVMVFSHGLGGTKNAYSHLLGSMASHGMVVIAPEHRDGSAPISVIRMSNGSAKRIDYVSLPHEPSQTVEDARNKQLKVRLWELGLVHEALLKLNRGENISNVAAETSHRDRKSLSQGELSMFAFTLDVNAPGRISWAGHSFGAATIIQFVKSVFYQRSASIPESYQPLYTPAASSSIVKQITPFSSISLLDIWCLPLHSNSTEWLWRQPLPCYTKGGPGGSVLLAILSEAFYKWKGNYVQTERVLSPNPWAEQPSALGHKPPHVFYPIASAHLSQSDFGILFPWMTKKFLKADDPARTLRLNVRAMLEVLRRGGTAVADTSPNDMEEAPGSKIPMKSESTPIGQDRKILATDGSVTGWVSLKLGEHGNVGGKAMDVEMDARADPVNVVVENEVIEGGRPDVKV